MESVIGLVAAALERAFTLVHDGVVNVQDAVKEMAGKKKKFMLPKTLNKVTGTMSKGNSMFSINNWGSETQSYTTALIKKGPENTSEIVQTVLGLLNCVPEKFKSCYDGDVINPRSLLW
ncbi:hypothetical protein HD554DRAFT_2035687 [Boletus coccyginus]|nr:hypothetical protein HD554DRAFT_2035687 [Boletus coccyginus]